MADDDDQEEFLDFEDPDFGSPGSAEPSEVIQVIEESKTGSKSASLSSGNDKTPDKSVSEVPEPEEPRAESIRSGSVKTNGSVSEPRSQHSRQSRESAEETSKSQEVIRKSQELSLSGKQSSLDRLSEKKETVQRTKISKWQRQCNRQFRDMIGKREMKNEELERQQGDLRQRLNILECSMPAVMVWNIWRMTQGANAPGLQQVLEKQFQGPAAGEVYCPTTPSRHFDCRVREAEAERKQAQKRAEEARSLWAEKMANLEDREKRLQEARKLQEEQQKRIEQLTTEVQKLREARSTEDDGACEAGECGVIECKKKWLEKVPSSASIRSTDIECLEKLHELAAAELCMKRQIDDLERREQAYMRTLQQADELWNRLEGDTTGTIQEQLEVKTERIAELEEELQNLRARMATCREELEKYMSIGKIEALIGRDDDFAGVRDMEALAGVSVKDEMTPGKEGMEEAMEEGMEEGMEDVEKLKARLAACRDELGKYISVEELEAIVGKDDDKAGDFEMDVKYRALGPGHVDLEESTVMDAKDFLAQLGSLSELNDPGTICGPDFDCNDVGLTETGLPSEERIALEEDRVTARELLEKYGLVEIAEQLGAKFATDAIQYKMVVKTETQISEYVEGTETTYSTDEIVEREIAYEEEAGDDDRVKEEELEVQEEELEVKEEELEVQEDEVGVQEDDVGMQEDEVGVQEEKLVVQEDDVGMQEDEVGVQKEELEVQEEELGVQEEELEVQEDEVGVQEDEVGVQEDEIGVMEDEVGEEDSKPSKKAEGVSVPMEQLSSWQDRVHAVRMKIVECPSCNTMDREAQILADELAAYTGRTMELEAKERIAEDKESLEVREETREVVQEEDEVKLDRKEDDKTEFVEAVVKEVEEREPEPVDVVEPVKEERAFKPEPEEPVIEARIPEEPVIEARRPEEPVIEARTPEEPVIEARTPEEPVIEARIPEEVKEQVPAEYPSAGIPISEDTAVADAKVKAEEVLEETVPKEIGREPAEVTEKVTVTAAEMKPERLAEEAVVAEDEEIKKEEVPEKEEAAVVMEVKPEVVTEVKLKEEAPLEKIDAEEVPEIARVIEQMEELEEKEPEPAVREELEEVPKEEPEITVKEEKIEHEETVPEEDEVEEVPVERLEEFQVAVEVDIIPVEEEPDTEERETVPTEIEVDVVVVEEVPDTEERETVPTEIEVDVVLVEEVPTEEKEVPEVIVAVKEEPKAEEEGIIPEEVEIEEIKVEVVEELKPEEIVLEEEEIKIDVVPKEEPLRPKEEEIVQIPLEEAEEEIKAEVPELEKIELEVKVLEDAKVAEVDVEIEVAPVEVLKEKDEEIPEEPEEIEISIDEECVCDGVYDVEYLFPPVTEAVAEEESVCQCMAEDYPPEEEEELGECQCSTEGLPDAEETPEDCQCENGASQDPVAPVEKEDSGVCKCTSKAPSDEKAPSVKKEDSDVCKCTSKAPSGEKTPSVKKEDSDVCKCTSKAPSGEKTPSVKKGVCDICKCTSKAPSGEKAPSVKKEDSGVCKCTSKAPSGEKAPSVKKEDSGVCKCTSKAPSVEKTRSAKKEDSGVCTCMSQPPVKAEESGDPTKRMPTQRDQSGLPPQASALPRKVEVTQTSITHFEAQKTTIQAVTQTVADVGMQAQPPPTLLRQHQQPKVTTRVIDTDPEILERLTRWKRSQDPSGTTTAAVTSQTEKSSFLRILQTLKTTGAYSKLEPEKELRTIHYGKKSDDAEGRCNCCLCGKTVQDTLPVQKPPVDVVQGQKRPVGTLPGAQTSSVMRLLQALPTLSKTPAGVDQGIQHESFCNECNAKRLQRSVKPQAPSMKEPKQVQTTTDQAVSVSRPTLKGATCGKPKKSDHMAMAMIKIEKTGKRMPPSEKPSALKSQQETSRAKAEDKPEKCILEERKEDEDQMECVCSSKGAGVKKIRCACGDPD